MTTRELIANALAGKTTADTQVGTLKVWPTKRIIGYPKNWHKVANRPSLLCMWGNGVVLVVNYGNDRHRKLTHATQVREEAIKLGMIAVVMRRRTGFGLWKLLWNMRFNGAGRHEFDMETLAVSRYLRDRRAAFSQYLAACRMLGTEPLDTDEKGFFALVSGMEQLMS